MDHTHTPAPNRPQVHLTDHGPDDEDDYRTSPELTPQEQALHQENMAKLGRIMRAFGILKIGVTTLLIVIIIKFFGR
ncbi:hypothetical protein [Candidatus Phycosocius spiralis]|uniref:Uncharacterized protein n=1 Tax=Candidatus Phycosocius spiralis TaxID=2815099 RepID=A0ABQ4PY75_9PROT|nr:hypothetical protein [Candidatus Phycosocius spiralis]GIU67638.1 hypothetical protein PsB1_1792 [Candidatus Phycosocius spiralis]